MKRSGNANMTELVGLPVYELFIHPYDLYMLGDPLSDNSAEGTLRTGGSNYDIRVKCRGHHTRNLPKSSYFIKLIYPRRHIGSREFHLNAEYNDPSFIRNKLALDLFQLFGVLAPTSQHIQLFLNEKYEGVYLQLESVDDLFLKKRGLPPGQIYYAENHHADFSLVSRSTKEEKKSLMQGYSRKIGSYHDVSYLSEFIRMINTQDFEEDIHNYLDVEKYLRWLAVAVCTQNLDGFYHNYALYRNSETGIFEIMPWDYDATFGRDWDGDIVEFDALSIKGKNILSQKLLEVPEYRKQYRKLMEKLLNTLFTPVYLEPIIESHIKLIHSYLLFNDIKQKQLFQGEKDYILTFIKKRNQYLRSSLILLD